MSARVSLGRCSLALIAAMTVYAALALWLTRDTTLFLDETNIFTVDRGFRPSALLTPLNGHLVLFQRLLYAADFELFGANFVIVRLIEVAGVILVVALFFILAKRRVGAAAALAPAVLLLFFGSAWELNFVVSGLGNVYAIAAGLGALVALERRDRRGDLIACALLVVSITTFTLGLAFAVGVTVLILLEPDARRRIWVTLIPLALYAAWFVWVRAVYVPDHGEVQSFEVWNVLLVPNFIADAAASVAGALAGLNYDFEPQDFIPVFRTESPYGPVLAVLAVAALVLAMRRGTRPPFLWALLAALATFWVALALGFGTGRNPSVVRYVYGGGILALLIAAEAARGVRLSRTALVVLYAVTALALCANLARLREGTDFYRSFATGLRAQLTAVELAAAEVDRSFLPPSGPLKTAGLRAGPYLDAVRRTGSPAYSPRELSGKSETNRADADVALVAGLGIGLDPSGAEPGVGCREIAGGPGSSTSFVVRSPGVTVSSPSGGRLALRRFASSSSVTVGSLPADQPVELRIPPDGWPRPWRASVAPAASITVCQRG